MKRRLLIITDHSTHAPTNSLYELAIALYRAGNHHDIFVCSKGLSENNEFFAGDNVPTILASPVNDDFFYEPEGNYFLENATPVELSTINYMLVRMPQPLDKKFLLSLEKMVPKGKIINDPTGTIETSSKEFLVQIPHLCPTPSMCYSIEEAIMLSMEYEIVLKPLYSYGGKGIARLSKDAFWSGPVKFPVEEVHQLLSADQFPMLAMRYLPNVSLGDKRTIVVNRRILGSALRLPPPDSWICNVAQGGYAILSEADEAELKIEQELTPMLFEKGIVMYGFDTLLDDNGIRVLSEINTLSIGGMGPIEEMSGKPILKEAASLLWAYLENK